MPKPLRAAPAVALALAALVSGGCRQYGPGTINASRIGYNEVINRTANEQLLLNLVRLKYRDTPFFMEVSSVTTSFSFGASLSTTADPTTSPYFNPVLPGVSYGERPTVSYTPLHGDKFVKQLLSPISLDTLVLLYHSGWSVERVFRCCVQRMNGLRNAPSASGPTPDYAPRHERFRQVAGTMRRLQKAGHMDLGATPDGKGYALRIAKTAAGGEDVAELHRLLGTAPDRGYYRLTTDVVEGAPEMIGVSTRSLLGVLFYVSQSVEVPERDEWAGRVTVTATSDGDPFDWTEVTGDIIRIRWSGGRPPGAAVAVPYRGGWFYLADDDLNSKSTFSLLSQLFSLQAGRIRMEVPVMTIPVGR
jgi:hypothetical protein